MKIGYETDRFRQPAFGCDLLGSSKNASGVGKTIEIKSQK